MVRSFIFWVNVTYDLLGNATTNDLWSALSEASKQDVNSFMVGLVSRL
jgi:aminopeptidase N